MKEAKEFYKVTAKEQQELIAEYTFDSVKAALMFHKEMMELGYTVKLERSNLLTEG